HLVVVCPCFVTLGRLEFRGTESFRPSDGPHGLIKKNFFYPPLMQDEHFVRAQCRRGFDAETPALLVGGVLATNREPKTAQIASVVHRSTSKTQSGLAPRWQMDTSVRVHLSKKRTPSTSPER